MMKKISPPFFLIVLLLSSVSGFAREEAPAQPLAFPTLQEEKGNANFPLGFSVTPGKWSQAKAGQLFTTGTHAPDFTLPSLKEEPVPIRYPRWAVQEGWEGTFVIAVEVLKTGEVGRWQIMRSTGYSLLDETATKAVRAWRFHPATEQGRAIVSCIQIPIRFELKEPPSQI